MPATMDSRERTIRGLQASCLSLLPGLGHLYIGERKGLKVLPGSLLLLAVARYWWAPMLLIYLGLAVWTACDAFRIVKRGRGGQPLLTPSAPPTKS